MAWLQHLSHQCGAVAGYFHKKPQLIRFFQIDNKVYQNDGPFPWTYIQYKQNFDGLMRVPSCGNCRGLPPLLEELFAPTVEGRTPDVCVKHQKVRPSPGTDLNAIATKNI